MEDMLAQLSLSQNELVQKEKMAALGSLVAGVSHEVNTPIGITYTVATHLAESYTSIRKKFTDGRMSKNDFQSFLNNLDESLQLLLSNTRRATELIKSFKMMAVDQTSGERRIFNLRDYIDEVLLNLRPRLKKTTHIISVECPGNLQLDSYPGALSQILANLILNSLTHAFPDEASGGHLTIQVAQPDPEYVELRYSDDGCGIPPEQQNRVFEPFFTTKRNNGGSGLGLHLVYNLTTGSLNGQVSLESQHGRGTMFKIRFPRIASRLPA
jgi:two-component system NtrC family sensor kinase